MEKINKIIMHYKNIASFNVNNRKLGLFEIYAKQRDIENEEVYGYSVRFKTRNTTFKRFETRFKEIEGKGWDIEDKHYGRNYWDFHIKENALAKIQELSGSSIGKVV